MCLPSRAVPPCADAGSPNTASPRIWISLLPRRSASLTSVPAWTRSLPTSKPPVACASPSTARTATLRVYSLQEIAVEKLVALSDRARNEPRDLYDLHFLTSEAGVRLSEL